MLLKIDNTLRNFSNTCRQVGLPRQKVLEKSVAAAIAYAAPCFNGDSSQAMQYYRTSVMHTAIAFISRINETVLLNVDAVMQDVMEVWLGRYYMLNSPLFDNRLINYTKELSTFGGDVSGCYYEWVEKFSVSMGSDWDALNPNSNTPNI